MTGLKTAERRAWESAALAAHQEVYQHALPPHGAHAFNKRSLEHLQHLSKQEAWRRPLLLAHGVSVEER